MKTVSEALRALADEIEKRTTRPDLPSADLFAWAVERLGERFLGFKIELAYRQYDFKDTPDLEVSVYVDALKKNFEGKNLAELVRSVLAQNAEPLEAREAIAAILPAGPVDATGEPIPF